MIKPPDGPTTQPGPNRGKRATVVRMAEVAFLVLATLAACLVTWFAREVMRRPPFPVDALRVEFNPFALGLSLQALIGPLVLVYLLSSTRTFRRIVSGEVRRHDRLRLTGMLVMIELITLVAAWSMPSPDRTVYGLFIVLIGGLLGGWPVGLGLGLIGMLGYGTIVYVIDIRGGVVAWALRGIPPGADVWPFLHEFVTRLGTEFVLFYIINLRASVSIWVGIAGGLAAGWLKERWRSPIVALVLGATLELVAGSFVLLTAEAPIEFLHLLIASSLLTGMATVAFALIVRSVLAEIAHRKAAEAELALARAELRALRAQIKPHFLFNALNTIRYFVRTDPETARQLLLNLSEVFQRAIRSGEFVSLRDELSCVQAYLSLEQARLGERLRVTWAGEVTQPDRVHEMELPLLDQMVPTLSVQPIVENAVIHGVSKKPEGGTICIETRSKGNDLVIQVDDDGGGIEPARLAEILKPAAEGDHSIGLRNVDGRLRALYGEEYGLVVESSVGRGTQVKLLVPVQRI